MVSPEPLDDFERLVALACRILQVPTAAITFVDDEAQHFKAMRGFSADVTAERGTPLSHSFCKHVVIEGTPLTVPDSRAHPVLRTNPAVEELNVAAYLGVPIHSPDGEVLGSFCAISNQPRDWTEDDVKTLRDLTKVVEAEIVLRAAVANRDLVLDEMTHRIKNLCTVIIGMIRLDRHQSDTASELAERLANRVQALGAAHELIIPVAVAGAVGESNTDLQTLTTKLLRAYLLDGHLSIAGPEVTVGEKAAVQIALALHEISTNAVKYGALSVPEGRVHLTWEEDGDRLALSWNESGHAWTAGVETGQGFGSRLLDLAIRASLAGTVETHVTPTSFSVQIEVPRASLEH
ncbi:MAG: GAF domain-containing protein [Pseudomonadota bacterium]